MNNNMKKNIKKVVSQYSQDDVSKVYKKRVFIYIRVSTTEQAEEGYSLGEQEERLKKEIQTLFLSINLTDCQEVNLIHFI